MKKEEKDILQASLEAGCRTQLLLAPELHARIKAAADHAGLSFDVWCSAALERAVRDAEREREIDEALAGDWSR